VKTILVTGAGGFIGHHLVKLLVKRGEKVRGVDIKYPEFEPSAASDFRILDLRKLENCLEATRGVDQVYHLAADMGGIGYITVYHAEIARNNTTINLNMLEAARQNGVGRFFFSSSACVYPQHLQKDADVTPLKEEDAHPADPEEGYGWEKLYMEKLCQWYREDWKLDTRVVRFHNIFGPLGTYEGGKEKAPAALSRKIALAKLAGEREIEIWGDGEQSRSFCYIDDCVRGIYELMQSNHVDPINLGQDRLITIDALADMVAAAAGIEIVKKHVAGPQGVRGRNSDNSRVKQVLKWEPHVSLEEGIARTYAWIEARVREGAVLAHAAT
jgi:nucleoside-diphosphate-sugar epimerase